MPIFTNIVGAIRLLTDVTVNVGGVLHELDTVHANVSGVLREIFSAWKAPSTLNWSNGAAGLSVTAEMGYNSALYAEFSISKDTKVTVSCTHNSGATNGNTLILDSSGKTLSSVGWSSSTKTTSAVLSAGTYKILANGGGMSGTYPNLSPVGYNITLNVSFSKA